MHQRRHLYSETEKNIKFLYFREFFKALRIVSLICRQLGNRTQGRHKHRQTERESEASPALHLNHFIPKQACLWSPAAIYQLPTGLRLFQSQHDRPGTEWVHLHHNLLKSHQVSASVLVLPVAQRCHHITQQHSKGYRRLLDGLTHVFPRGLAGVFGCFAVGFCKPVGFKISLQVSQLEDDVQSRVSSWLSWWDSIQIMLVSAQC